MVIHWAPTEAPSVSQAGCRSGELLHKTHIDIKGICSRVCHPHQATVTRRQGVWLPLVWHYRDAGTPSLFLVSSNKHIITAQDHSYSCATNISLFILIPALSLPGILPLFPADLLSCHTFSSMSLGFCTSVSPLLSPTSTWLLFSALRTKFRLSTLNSSQTLA